MIDREALKKAENAYRQKYKEFFPGSWPDAETCTAMATATINAYLTSAGEGAVPVVENELRAFGEHLEEMLDRQYTIPIPEDHAITAAYRQGVGAGWDLAILQMAKFLDARRAELAAAPRPPRQDGAREGDDARLQELQEIADGAWGDGPMRRGQARDLLMKATTTPAPDEAVEAEREACALEALMVGSRIASHQGRAAARLCAKAIRARSRRDVGGGV